MAKSGLSVWWIASGQSGREPDLSPEVTDCVEKLGGGHFHCIRLTAERNNLLSRIALWRRYADRQKPKGKFFPS